MKVLDTHKMVKHLVEKNFTEEQAEAIVSVVQEVVERPKLDKGDTVAYFTIIFTIVIAVMILLFGPNFFKK